MADDKRYNGWANYETWNVALWLDNDEHTYGLVREMAQECWDAAESTNHLTREDWAKQELSDRLKAHVEEMQPDLGASMFADLLGAALSEVDWYEMAEHYLSDVDKRADWDESNYTDIINAAKSTWFAAHPNCDIPTTEATDEAINKALGLPVSGSLRGLDIDLADMAESDITKAVESGLDAWLAETPA